MVSAATFWRSVSCVLAFLLLAQWILFSFLLHHVHEDPRGDHGIAVRDEETQSVMEGVPPRAPPVPAGYEGVAVTVMLRAPKWFHRRYTAMLHNALANIPPNWMVQVFINEQWLEKDVLPLHPGLRDLMGKRDERSSSTSGHERIAWNPIPKDMIHKKPKQILKSRWFWESVLAENVFMFSGNGALCANSEISFLEFTSYDYVGTPWNSFKGTGGDGGTHSFRHRSAMLAVLDRYPPKDDSTDSQYFVGRMLEHNQGAQTRDNGTDGRSDHNGSFKMADKATTRAFGGVTEFEKAPLVLSGTQAHLNWTMRDKALSACPEVKIIFPSLHEPSCFGAHPNGPKCKESICALQDNIPSHGC